MHHFLENICYEDNAQGICNGMKWVLHRSSQALYESHYVSFTRPQIGIWTLKSIEYPTIDSETLTYYHTLVADPPSQSSLSPLPRGGELKPNSLALAGLLMVGSS